ncbi:MAG: cardiolipin synthase B [Elusimicrobia bacterium]|nr:cardiolipin synthase B [Elusimicrobiota bacterium]
MEEKNYWREYCLNQENALNGNAVRLFKNSEEAFAETLRTLRSAKKFALLEFYAFADDAVGRAFKDLLIKKAKEGVGVYLIYDAVGSILTDRDFFSKLAAGGVNVAEFRPVVLWKPYWNWLKRDHRKLICVDGEAALVGGFNITEQEAPISMGGRGWKNAQVRVEGPAVPEVEKLFWESWGASSKFAGACAPPPGPDRGAGGEKHKTGGVYVSVVSATGLRNFRSIRRSYSYAIDRAKKYIYITNAYFLPDRFVYRRLIRAVGRGVDVRIIGPYKTDHPYIRWASWSMYPHMIKNGVKLYEWQGEILHSKTAVIDGIWASVGSHNLDHRSMQYNLEVNINVFDRGFGAALAGAFMEDLANSKPVTLLEAKSRPFLSKAASKLLYLFRSWA